MKRITMPVRPDHVAQLEALGFVWHTMYDAPYWDESAAYAFSLAEIENDLEDPTAELLALCHQAVEYVVGNASAMDCFQIPVRYQDLVRASWREQERDLYGRFDLSYDGRGPAKLLEFNADTPTGLFETAVVQWQWLEDMKGRGLLGAEIDQFNSVHEKLIAALGALDIDGDLYLGGALDLDEDAGTLAYLADCATQAGLICSMIDMQLIGVDIRSRFTDMQDRVIGTLFKLYPWELLFREAFGPRLLRRQCRMIEPAWKAILSNKALLPLLWDMAPGHPNLLPAFHEGDPRAATLDGYARKPIFSREGANVTLHTPDSTTTGSDGGYGAEGFIVQQLAPLPVFDGNHAVIGSWVVAGQPAGICVREDASPITQNLSRFVPHIIA